MRIVYDTNIFIDSLKFNNSHDFFDSIFRLDAFPITSNCNLVELEEQKYLVVEKAEQNLIKIYDADSTGTDIEKCRKDGFSILSSDNYLSFCDCFCLALVLNRFADVLATNDRGLRHVSKRHDAKLYWFGEVAQLTKLYSRDEFKESLKEIYPIGIPKFPVSEKLWPYDESA